MLEVRQNCHMKVHLISFTMVYIMWGFTKSIFGVRLIE